MLDINLIRKNSEDIKLNLSQKGFEFDIEKFEELDLQRKDIQIKTESLQEKSNIFAKEIANEKDDNLKANKLSKATVISKELKAAKLDLELAIKNLNKFLLEIPNITLNSVPDGKSEKKINLFMKKELSLNFPLKLKIIKKLAKCMME